MKLTQKTITIVNKNAPNDPKVTVQVERACRQHAMWLNFRNTSSWITGLKFCIGILWEFVYVYLKGLAI